MSTQHFFPSFRKDLYYQYKIDFVKLKKWISQIRMGFFSPLIGSINITYNKKNIYTKIYECVFFFLFKKLNTPPFLSFFSVPVTDNSDSPELSAAPALDEAAK